MYLLIFEDGSIVKANSVSEKDIDAYEDGILELVDLSTDEPKQYYGGEWHEIFDCRP